jgi:hypothetical protein
VTIGGTSPPASPPTPTTALASTGPPAPTGAPAPAGAPAPSATAGALGVPTAGPTAPTAGVAGARTTVSRGPQALQQLGRPGTSRTLGSNRELGRSRVLGQLPFTGLALWLFVALGLALLGTGMRVRRYAYVS